MSALPQPALSPEGGQLLHGESVPGVRQHAKMKRILIALLLCLSPVAASANCGVPTTPRGATARRAFMRMTGHPHGWTGHVVDHIVPLCKGGPDTPYNMQWQTVAAAKAKDKIECRCGAKTP